MRLLLATYICAGVDFKDVPFVREETFVVGSVDDALKIIRHWNVIGKQQGSVYGLTGYEDYTGDFNSLTVVTVGGAPRYLDTNKWSSSDVPNN